MINVGVSKRGFIYRTTGDQLPRTTSENIQLISSDCEDKIIDDLWEAYRRRYTATAPMGLTLQLTKRLTQLIGDLDRYLIQTVQLKDHNEYVIDFLKDTILYTQTGCRKLPLSVWKELLDSDGECYKYQINVFDDMEIPTIEDLLSNWIAQENGLDDMFFTSYILFGKTPN